MAQDATNPQDSRLSEEEARMLLEAIEAVEREESESD